MKKRILSLVLAVVMVLCLVPAISMVSFAETYDYSILPDDENKQHFLDVMAAYGDETMPTAATINEKLTGYLAQNENWTNRQIAEYMATSIALFYVDEITVSDGEGGTTTQPLYDATFYNSMWEENAAIIETYLNEHPNTDRIDIRNNLHPLLLYVDGDEANGYRAYSTRNAANLSVLNATKDLTTIDDAATFAASYADAIFTAGVWTPEAPLDETSQEAYVAAAVEQIINEKGLTTLETLSSNNITNSLMTPLMAGVEFRVAINVGGNTDVAHNENNSGFKYYLQSAYDTAVKKSAYGTNKVANFYLNFTDVKLEDDAKFTDAETEKAKLKAILDYYFAPGAGNYGYYEDLWYDDGHLIFFIDTANLNNPYATTQNAVPTSDTDSTQVPVEPSHFAKAVIASFNGQGSYTKSDSSANPMQIHSYVKSVGGQQLGRYFNIIMSDTTTGQQLIVKVDEDGFLNFTPEILTSFSSAAYSGLGRYSGIGLGYTYDFDQIQTNKVIHNYNATSNESTEHNYFHDNGLSMTADADGYYGGFTLQAAVRVKPEFWLSNIEKYPNLNITSGNAYNKYASQLGTYLCGITADGGNSFAMSGGLIHIGSRYDETLNDGAGGYVITYNNVNSGYNNGGANIGSSSAHTADLGTYMAITTAANYTGIDKVAQIDYFYLNGTYKTATYQYMETSGEKAVVPNTYSVLRSAKISSATLYSEIALNLVDKQLSSFRAYDVSLTEEQVMQNSFADLAYEKGVDLTDYYALNEEQKGAVLEYFDGADFDTVTKADIESYFTELLSIVKYDAEYSEYAHLWYDDGHLMSFVDLMNISENQRYVTQDFGSVSYQFVKDSYRLITGNSSHGSFDGSNYHTFVRITGGQNAGRWYPLISRYGGSTWAFPTVDGGFTDFGHQDSSNSDGGLYMGMFIGTSYDDATVSAKLPAGRNASFVPDDYIMPNASANNSLTVDAALYYKPQSMIANSSYYAYFLTAYDSVRSTDQTNNFEGLTNTTPYKQTESYGALTIAYINGANSVITDFVNGYAQRFGGHSGKANMGESLQHASYVSYTSSYSFSSGYRVLLNNPTTGINIVTKDATYEKACASGHDEHPFYGAYTHMNTLFYGCGRDNYIYYLRTYDVKLTAEQMMQNHFADLMYYNKIDTAKYDALSDNDKMTLWAWATDYKLSDADAKAAVESKIDELAQKSTELVNFKGFQARLHTNVGIRSVFYLDNVALEGFTVKAYGAIVAADQGETKFDELIISYDEESGAVTVSSNFGLTASTVEGFMTIADNEKAYILGSNENLDDYTMFAYTVNYINGTIDRTGAITGESLIESNKDVELLFRAFAVVEYKGATYIHYADGASANYNNSSVSLTEISNYYAAYNNGEFANNACINAVVGAQTPDEE